MPRLVNERADAVAALREVFREHGYEGASLSLIERRSGLGKGSLYHFFPGGKEEMALAVLQDIDAWFELHMFAPLREAADAPAAVRAMFRTCIDYFRSGERICLLGIFALGDMRDRFPVQIDAYFNAWESALTSALRRCAKSRLEASALAQDIVAGIQGALVISRAHNNTRIFKYLLNSLEKKIKT